MNWRIHALIVAVALSGGFCLGYHIKGQADQAAVVKQASAAVKEASAGIVQSAVHSQQVEAAIQQTDSNIDQLKTAAQARLQKGKTHEPTARTGHGPDHVATTAEQPGAMADAAAGCRTDDVLDFGTVRLLNRARDEGTMESSPGHAR
ncbi:hypothetical protein [Massilia sp. TN1-12]|uniref:hypothetical protein n=1 Tax=Massilia paldalensis TaxID=3377675 RepID=UPI00384FB103